MSNWRVTDRGSFEINTHNCCQYYRFNLRYFGKHCPDIFHPCCEFGQISCNELFENIGIFTVWCIMSIGIALSLILVVLCCRCCKSEPKRGQGVIFDDGPTSIQLSDQAHGRPVIQPESSSTSNHRDNGGLPSYEEATKNKVTR